jgi:hypothetical protein
MSSLLRAQAARSSLRRQHPCSAASPHLKAYKTQDPRPTRPKTHKTQDPRPKTQDPRPIRLKTYKTQDPRPETRDLRPKTYGFLASCW